MICDVPGVMMGRKNKYTHGSSLSIYMMRMVADDYTLAGSATGGHVFEHFWMDGVRARASVPITTRGNGDGKGLRPTVWAEGGRRSPPSPRPSGRLWASCVSSWLVNVE